MVSPSDYDALADLFLAGGSFASDAGAAPSMDRSPSPRPTQGARAAQAGLAGAEVLESHDSIVGTVAPLSTPFRGNVVAIDASHSPIAPGPRTRPVLIEGLILGHLPVFAAGWVSQYAKRLAEERQEPVALIRAQGGRCEIDLVGNGPASPALDGPTTPLTPATLTAAVHDTALATGTWTIRVDEPGETGLATLEGLDRITILTGADDVALAATYRTLKFVVGQMKDASIDLSSPLGGSRLRVVIMGATDEKAATAQDKLRGMMAAFLGTELDVVVGPQRLSPTLMASVYRDLQAPELAAIVSLVRGAPSERRATSSRIGPTRMAAPVPPAIAAAAPVIEPKIAVAPVSASTFEPGAVAAVAASGVVSGVVQGASPASSVGTPNALELVHHVPGLVKLPIACPYIGEAEFAADSAGNLHVLSKADAELSAGEAVSRLVSAMGWLADHLALIRLALPRQALAATADETTLHVFTDQPKAARRLLDSGVKVHFLAGVQVGGTTAWVCRELN